MPLARGVSLSAPVVRLEHLHIGRLLRLDRGRRRQGDRHHVGRLVLRRLWLLLVLVLVLVLLVLLLLRLELGLELLRGDDLATLKREALRKEDVPVPQGRGGERT